MLAFADQSGTIHKNAPESRPVLLTLCMMEYDVGDLTRRIHNMKERIFGLEDENNRLNYMLQILLTQNALQKKQRTRNLLMRFLT